MLENFNTLLQTLSQYKLFPAGQTIIVAVSGGPDSLALLHWLHNNQSRLSVQLHVATLDHGIRPSAAADVAFVEQFARTLGVPCTSGKADVPALVSEQQLSIEDAARIARYQFLARVAAEHSATHVTTGHHAGDQSETILMHIVRGTGTSGLSGMALSGPVPGHPGLTLLRPFLLVEQAAIDDYCQRYQLEPRIDATNQDTRLRRNRLRHEILPRLREINPQLDESLARLSSIVGTENTFIEDHYRSHCQPDITYEARVTVPLAKFRSWHRALQRRFFMDALAHLGAEPSFERVESAIEIAISGNVGAIVEFAGDARLRLGYDLLYVEPASLPLPVHPYHQITEPQRLLVPGNNIVNDWVLEITDVPLPDYDACLHIPEGADVSLRTRQPGDTWQPAGLGSHHQKIKSWLIDNKIPRHVRDGLPLVTIDGSIAAIVLPQAWAIAEGFGKHELSQFNFYFKVEDHQ